MTRSAVTRVDALVIVRERQRHISQPPRRPLKLFPSPTRGFTSHGFNEAIDSKLHHDIYVGIFSLRLRKIDVPGPISPAPATRGDRPHVQPMTPLHRSACGAATGIDARAANSGGSEPTYKLLDAVSNCHVASCKEYQHPGEEPLAWKGCGSYREGVV